MKEDTIEVDIVLVQNVGANWQEWDRQKGSRGSNNEVKFCISTWW